MTGSHKTLRNRVVGLELGLTKGLNGGGWPCLLVVIEK